MPPLDAPRLTGALLVPSLSLLPSGAIARPNPSNHSIRIFLQNQARSSAFDPPSPPPARISSRLTGFAFRTEKNKVRLTVLCYFILLFNWTISPWRIAAGNIFTTVPSLAPNITGCSQSMKIHMCCLWNCQKVSIFDCVVPVSSSHYLRIARSSWLGGAMPINNIQKDQKSIFYFYSDLDTGDSRSPPNLRSPPSLTLIAHRRNWRIGPNRTTVFNRTPLS